MNEVSCRTLSPVFRHAKHTALPPERLAADVDYPLERLLRRRARIDWPALSQVLHRAAAIWGDGALEALGRDWRRAPRIRPLAAARRLFTPTRELYRDLCRPDGELRRLVTCLRPSFVELDERLVVVTVELEQGHEPRREVFELLAGMLAGLPRRHSLPDAEINLTATARGARYLIRIARRRAPLAALRKVLGWPIRALSAARELESVSEALLQRQREVELAHLMLAEHESKLATAHAINRLVQRGLDIDHMLAEIARLLVELGGFGRAELTFQVEAGARIEQREVAHGAPPEALQAAQPLDLEVMTSRNGLETRLTLYARPGLGDRERDALASLAEFLEPVLLMAIDNARAVTALEQQQHLLNERLYELSRAREVAERSVRLRSQFVANMSHEIRTPLAGVIGMVQLLRATSLDADQREYVELLELSGQTLLAVVNDVLDFSKIEAGKLQLDIVDFDPVALVEEVIDLFANEAEKKGIDLVCETAVGDDRMLRGDPMRIRQIMTNLTSNALKFTSKGSVQLRMHIDPGPDAHRLRLDVVDTGIGIDQVFAKNLFEPFVQADGTTTRRFGGTGLGLTITKQLCDIMGASISVASELGKGASFTVEMFLPASDERRRGLTARRPSDPTLFAMTADELAGRRVIVASDRTASRGVITRALLPKRVDVAVATSLDELMRLLRTAQPAAPPGLVPGPMPGPVPTRVPILVIDERLADQTVMSEVRGMGPMPIVLVRLPAGATPTIERARADATIAWPVRSSEVVARVLEGLMHHTRRSAALARQRGGEAADASRAELAVLVVSGDAVGRRIAARILARHCDRVDVAASWAEGLVRMRAEAYDLALCERSVPPECYADAQRVSERAQLEHGTLLVAIGGESASATPEARQALTAPLPLRWDGVLERLSDEAELVKLIERVGEHDGAPDDGAGRVANLSSPA